MENSVSMDMRHSDRDVNKRFHESFKNPNNSKIIR